jgi:hypothetical protein
MCEGRQQQIKDGKNKELTYKENNLSEREAGYQTS